jgi:hypothetical protein
MSRARRQRRYRARRAARTLPAFDRALRWAYRCPGMILDERHTLDHLTAYTRHAYKYPAAMRGEALWPSRYSLVVVSTERKPMIAWGQVMRELLDAMP